MAIYDSLEYELELLGDCHFAGGEETKDALLGSIKLLSETGVLSNEITAKWAANALKRAIYHLPLTPLHRIGEAPDEWVDCGDCEEHQMQNKRCSSVFYNRKDDCYTDLNGPIFFEHDINAGDDTMIDHLIYSSGKLLNDKAQKAFDVTLNQLNLLPCQSRTAVNMPYYPEPRTTSDEYCREWYDAMMYSAMETLLESTEHDIKAGTVTKAPLMCDASSVRAYIVEMAENVVFAGIVATVDRPSNPYVVLGSLMSNNMKENYNFRFWSNQMAAGFARFFDRYINLTTNDSCRLAVVPVPIDIDGCMDSTEVATVDWFIPVSYNHDEEWTNLGSITGHEIEPKYEIILSVADIRRHHTSVFTNPIIVSLDDMPYKNNEIASQVKCIKNTLANAVSQTIASNQWEENAREARRARYAELSSVIDMSHEAFKHSHAEDPAVEAVEDPVTPKE